jgi:hypothetical protein
VGDRPARQQSSEHGDGQDLLRPTVFRLRAVPASPQQDGLGVKLSYGEYEVHNIGVNWPHHIFVSQDFKVLGAD